MVVDIDDLGARKRFAKFMQRYAVPEDSNGEAR